MSSQNVMQPVAALPFVFIIAILLFALALTALMVLAMCMICARAGFPWALGLLSLVPIANLVLWPVLAFSKWPIQREVERLRQSAGAVPPPHR